MKKIILPIIALGLFAACNNKKDDSTYTRALVMTDTVNLQPSTSNTDVAAAQPAPAKQVVYAAPRVVYVEKYIPAPTPKKEKPQATPAPEAAPLPAPAPTPAPEAAPAPDVATTIPADVPVENKKKGISDAAKAAAIGGVGGAVAGAIIGKNAKGAIIGGVVGAAGGYILGRAKDKKSGRIDMVNN